MKIKLIRERGVALSMGSAWYDHCYGLKKGRNYENYHPLWDTILNWITPQEGIADLGCGPGAFAERAKKAGKRYIVGVDYSEVAIRQAKERVPKWAKRFICADLSTYTIPRRKVDVVVMTEVLEHLPDDLSVLAKFPKGTRILLSVPASYAVTHIRIFPTMDDAIQRYSGLLCIQKSAAQKVNMENAWLFDSVRKD